MVFDGKNTVQAKQWLHKCYSDSAPSETTVKRWYADFKRSCTDTNDAELSDRPNSAVVLEKTKKLHKLVLADRKLKLREIAEELKISEGSVFVAVTDLFSLANQCPRQAIRPHTDKIRGQSALIPSSSQELLFLVLFGSLPAEQRTQDQQRRKTSHL